jgi:hypothetical protein
VTDRDYVPKALTLHMRNSPGMINELMGSRRQSQSSKEGILFLLQEIKPPNLKLRGHFCLHRFVSNSVCSLNIFSGFHYTISKHAYNVVWSYSP